jgi:hypothetical protein
VSTWTAHYNRHVESEEQQLYDHLLRQVQVELPEQLIQRFRALFVDGVGYPDPIIANALDKIISSKAAEQEFKFVLNRCCHILINRWQARPQFQTAIPELVAIFDDAPAKPVTEFSRSRSVRRMRELVRLFSESEQYLTLRRLAQVIAQANESANAGNQPLGTLIRRYPYLYEHCLLPEGSTEEQKQTINQLQNQVQRQFDIDLSQYVTYQVRRSQLANSTQQNSNRILQPVKNPTLLSDRELCFALKQFVGKVEGSYTCRDLAQRFLTHVNEVRSYGEFKDDFYQYITASIDPEYGKRQFNNQLHSQLRNILPESNSQKLNDFLMVRTCSQLLNFLVVESSSRPHHFVFIDLITNIGPTLATSLLLKIVLFCRKIKPYLEKRFSILFNHYEFYTRDGVQWLVKAMENLNVALSTNFSSVDLSYINQVV